MAEILPTEPIQVVQRVDRYGRVPENLLFNQDVSESECRLYAVLTTYDWRQSHQVWPTQKVLCERLGWGHTKLSYTLGALSDRGAISVRRRQRQPAVIELLADLILDTRSDGNQEALITESDGLDYRNRGNAPLTNETREQEIRAASAARGSLSDFEDWWSGWPKKLDKAHAKTAYRARRRQGVTHADLCAARDHYVRSKAGDLTHMKYPATFLNGQDGPWSEFVAGVPNGAEPAMSSQGPQTPTREHNGIIQRFYPGTGWIG